MRYDRLFRAEEDIDLPGEEKGVARALSDADIKERRRYALLISLEAEQELRDETSRWHRAYVKPLGTIDSAEPLVVRVLAVRRFDITEEAQLLFPYQFVALPDKPDDVVERNILAQRMEQEQKVRERRHLHVEQRMEELRQKLIALPIETLRKEAVGAAISAATRAEMIDAVRWYTVYAGIYAANTDGDLERLFQSPSEVRGVPTSVIDHLFQKVSVVNNVDPWEIQKNASTDFGTVSLTL